MKFVRRTSFGWSATLDGHDAYPTKGLVVHYDGNDQGLAKKGHAACIAYWKDTRKFHMGAKRGWDDIGYSFGACPHGYVFEGRGLNKTQAAQPGGNSTWYSCTFMSGEHETPTTAQVQAFRDLRKWLGTKGVAGTISYHGRFISTSCPGGILRKMATDGSLAGKGTPSKPSTLKAPSGDPVLKNGSTGARPKMLQRCLNKVIKAGLVEDGDFGDKTEAALKKFQKGRRDSKGKALSQDGEYGDKSRYALAKALG